jgi:hypothetical protein
MSRLSRLSWKTLPTVALLTGLLPLASAQAFFPISKPVPKNPVALFTFDTLSDGKDPAFHQLAFDKPITELASDFIDTSAFHPTMLTLSEGSDSVFDTGQHTTGMGADWLSAGALDLKGSSPFTQITLHSSHLLSSTVDDGKADVAPVPEASTLISFGALLVVGSLVLFVRRRKARA